MKTSVFSARKLCYVALFTALNIVLSSFGVPVPGGHLYLNDIVICFAALLFDPISAFIVGGVGAFFGDLIFYPLPMFVSLATHGLQAVAISLIAGKKESLPKVPRAILAVTVGEVINSDTFCTHFEKAYTDIDGAYTMLCREMARMVMAKHPDVRYVNREDDMGNPALRTSKLSYKPEEILIKYIVRSR